jgi:hypothetical protein
MTQVPAGHIRVSYLELVTEPPRAERAGSEHIAVETPDVDAYLALYRRVGGPLRWDTRLLMAHAELEALLSRRRGAGSGRGSCRRRSSPNGAPAPGASGCTRMPGTTRRRFPCTSGRGFGCMRCAMRRRTGCRRTQQYIQDLYIAPSRMPPLTSEEGLTPPEPVRCRMPYSC